MTDLIDKTIVNTSVIFLEEPYHFSIVTSFLLLLSNRAINQAIEKVKKIVKVKKIQPRDKTNSLNYA